MGSLGPHHEYSLRATHRTKRFLTMTLCETQAGFITNPTVHERLSKVEDPSWSHSRFFASISVTLMPTCPTTLVLCLLCFSLSLQNQDQTLGSLTPFPTPISHLTVFSQTVKLRRAGGGRTITAVEQGSQRAWRNPPVSLDLGKCLHCPQPEVPSALQAPRRL